MTRYIILRYKQDAIKQEQRQAHQVGWGVMGKGIFEPNFKHSQGHAQAMRDRLKIQPVIIIDIGAGDRNLLYPGMAFPHFFQDFNTDAHPVFSQAEVPE